jgi:undecaprenyl-diphosphatase
MSSFIDTLQSIDDSILLLINGNNSPFMDQVMITISGRFTWIPLYLLFAILIGLKYKKHSWVVILFAILVIIASDQVANLIKNEVMRSRPSHIPNILHLLHIYKNSEGESYMGGQYGFVSNHAANSAALSTYLILLFRNKFVTAGLIIWVLLLGYSRIYLGVHFPSDVLGGMVLGFILGFTAYKCCMFLQKGGLKQYFDKI